MDNRFIHERGRAIDRLRTATTTRQQHPAPNSVVLGAFDFHQAKTASRATEQHPAPNSPSSPPLTLTEPKPSQRDGSSLENRTERSGNTASAHTRTPVSNSLSSPTTAQSPITTPSNNERAPTRASQPSTELRTTAPSPTTAPSSSTLPSTRAPAPTTAPAPTVVPPESDCPGGDPRARQHQRLPCRPGQHRRRETAEHEVARAAYEGRRCADVEPVARFDVAEHECTGAQQTGERLPLHRDPAPGRDVVDHATGEDVATRVDRGW